MEAKKPEDFKRKLSQNLRIPCFLLIIMVIIILISVGIFFYTGGIKSTPQGIVQTGNLRINSEPTTVNVYINGEQKKLQEKRVTDLLPGEYSLKITAVGYLPWEKKVQVEAGIVQDINVRLFPANIKLEQFTHTNIQKAVFDPSGSYMYYVVSQAQKGDDIGIWRERLVQNGALDILTPHLVKITNLTADISDQIVKGDYQLTPSLDNNLLLLSILKPTRKDYILQASTYNEPQVKEALQNKIPYVFNNLSWFSNDSLLIDANALLSEFFLSTQQNILINYSATNPNIYTKAENRVYIYTPNNGLEYYQNKQLTKVNLNNITLPTDIKSLYVATKKETSLIYQTSDNTLTYLDLTNSYKYKLPANVSIVKFAPNGESAVLQTNDNKLQIFSIKDVLVLNKLETSLLDFSLLPASDINIVTYSSSGNNLLFESKKGEIFTSDLDGQNTRSLLAKLSPIGAFSIDNSDSKFYVLLADGVDNNNLKATNNVYTIKLVST